MKPPAIPGLSESLTGLSPSEWRTILARLRRARLLAPEDPHQPGQLDTHPLFRDYFGAQLRNRLSEAWRECNQRLYDHYRALAPRLPESIREMEHGAAVFSGQLRLPGRLVARHTARSVSARIQHPTGQCLPAVKSARFLHKQPTPPSTSSPLFIFRVALLRRLLTSGLFAVSAGFESEGARQKKIMQQQFSFLANLSSSVFFPHDALERICHNADVKYKCTRSGDLVIEVASYA